jgi:hypothetical protein
MTPLELTEEDAAAMHWVEGRRGGRRRPGRPIYLVPKDDTVITKVVPRTDAEVPHFSR